MLSIKYLQYSLTIQSWLIYHNHPNNPASARKQDPGLKWKRTWCKTISNARAVEVISKILSLSHFKLRRLFRYYCWQSCKTDWRNKGDLTVVMQSGVPHHHPSGPAKKKRFWVQQCFAFSFNLQSVIRVKGLRHKGFEKLLLACQCRWSAISEHNDWFLKVDVWHWKETFTPQAARQH